MLGFILLLILVAIVSKGGRNLIGALISLMFGVIFLMAGCAIM